MARVTYGALITELAGSIGGITFQRNSSGNIARLKPNMPVNVSENQQSQIFLLSQLVAAWSAFSDADKTSWNDLAAAHDHINEWSESKKLNGFQWFLSCNLNLLITDQAVTSTAPAWSTVAAVDPFTLTADGSNFDINWAPSVDLTGYYIIVYATPPLRQSSLKLRKSTFILDITGDAIIDTIALKILYEALFNVVWVDFFSNANCTIIIRTKLVQKDTGLASPYTSALIKIN